MAKWIIDELRYKAMVYRLQKSVTLRNGDISKSDSAVPPALIERVRRATADLEPGPLHRVEIIPRTNGHERSLIPLGLNPLVYGKSRILPDRLLSIDDALSSIGAGEILDLPQETGITREDMVWKVASRADLKVKPYSTNFQLLPSDLQLGPDGKWHIVSYINNLHPEKFREMYEIMAEIFNELVPVWNTTLTPLKDMLHSRARIEYHKVEYRPVPQEAMNTKPQYREGESENEFAERLNNWRSEHYKAIQPDADDFRPWAVPLSMMYNLPMDLSEPVRIEEGVQLNKDYGKTGLQAFFSLLEIRLTPEDPVYERPWHIEGQLVSLFFFFSSLSSYSISISNASRRMSISARRQSCILKARTLKTSTCHSAKCPKQHPSPKCNMRSTTGSGLSRSTGSKREARPSKKSAVSTSVLDE